MKPIVFLIAVLVSGCATQKSTLSRPQEDASPPQGFFVDPSFADGEAVLELMRRLFPATAYISLSAASLGNDDSHDYAQFFTGWGTDHGPEPIYYRHVIFAKKKTESWSAARVFDSGTLEPGPFSGPIELLESRGLELKDDVPNDAPPTPGPVSVALPSTPEPRQP